MKRRDEREYQRMERRQTDEEVQRLKNWVDYMEYLEEALSD